MLFIKWEQISGKLFMGLGLVLLTLFYLCRTRAFRNAMLKTRRSPKEKLAISIIGGLIAILGNYIGVPTDDGFANVRAVGVVVAGLIGGKYAGFGAGMIAGLSRYYLGGFSALGSAVSTILEGLFAGMLKERLPEGKKRWQVIFWGGFIFEVGHLALLVVFNRPIEQAIKLIFSVGPPMLFMNSIGIAMSMFILEGIFREKKLVEGAAAKMALNIASNTITYLRQGLSMESAEKTATIIYETVGKDIAAVVVTSPTKILAYAGIKLDHHNHGDAIYTKSTLNAIATKQYSLAQTRKEIGCSVKNCPLGSKIVAPLKDKDTLIGMLVLYKLEENSIRPFEIELIKGLAQLISTQFEISKVEHKAFLLEQAKIKALNAQINPHFLFNSLNTIMYYCCTKPEIARDLIGHLGNYYRNNLAIPDKMINLETEIRNVNEYVILEKVRFRGKLNVAYNINKDCHCFIPPLVIQPIVENAIKHGLYSKKEGGTVIISSRICNKNSVAITVKDNGIGMKESQIFEVLKPNPSRENIGISNVNERLKLFFGEKYGLSIESRLGKGTKVTINVPLN